MTHGHKARLKKRVTAGILFCFWFGFSFFPFFPFFSFLSFLFTEFPFVVFSVLDLNGTFVLKLKQQYSRLYLGFRHDVEMSKLKHSLHLLSFLKLRRGPCIKAGLTNGHSYSQTAAFDVGFGLQVLRAWSFHHFFPLITFAFTLGRLRQAGFDLVLIRCLLLLLSRPKKKKRQK